jgi:hypothetical protein
MQHLSTTKILIQPFFSYATLGIFSYRSHFFQQVSNAKKIVCLNGCFCSSQKYFTQMVSTALDFYSEHHTTKNHFSKHEYSPNNEFVRSNSLDNTNN